MQTTKEKKPAPSWMQVDESGALVTLSQPTSVNGVMVNSIRLRSPTVREWRAANAVHGSDSVAVEIMLFSSLADLGPNDLEGFLMKDYDRVQAAYFRVVADDER